MKLERFILNSDYATLRSKASMRLTIAVPSTITIPYGSPNAVYSAEAEIPGSASTFFRAMWGYSGRGGVDMSHLRLIGSNVAIAARQDGNEAQAQGTVFCENGKYYAQIIFPGSSFSDTTWTDVGGIYTVDIQTFLDPFRAN